MHVKIDFVSPHELSNDVEIKTIKDQIAHNLGMWILENSNFITDEDLKKKNIRKDLLVFTDVSRFAMFLEIDKYKLLESNF